MFRSDPRFTWKPDGWGKPDRALHFCGLCIGSVIPVREPSGPYRAWLMTDDEGDRVGNDKWETEDAARNALFTAALERVSSPELY